MTNQDLNTAFEATLERFQISEEALKQKQMAQMEAEQRETGRLEAERRKEVERRLHNVNENILGLIAECPSFADYLTKVVSNHHSFLYPDNTRIFAEPSSPVVGTEMFSVCHLWDFLIGGGSSKRIALAMGVPVTSEFSGKPVIEKTRIVLVQYHYTPSAGIVEYSRLCSYLAPGVEKVNLVFKELESSVYERVFKFFFERFGVLGGL